MQKKGESESRCGGSQGTHSGEGGKRLYQISWPAAGDSAGNPSRVNRDTWVLARESREPDRAERLFQAARRASKDEGWGERMDPDTRHSTGHTCSQLGNALEEIR